MIDLGFHEQHAIEAPRWEGSLSHAQTIRFDRRTGFFEGGADSRGDGSAMKF